MRVISILTIVVFAALTARPVIAQVSVKQYGATGNGTTDDTAAINNAITAARASNVQLLFPSGTYLVSGTLDFSSLNVNGSGYQNTTIAANVAMQTSTPFDVVQTKGGTSLANMTIDGGWRNGSTVRTGNGIATLSNPGASPPYYGYGNVFENLFIHNVNSSCIYINDGAYETIRTVRCEAFGIAGLYLDSDNYPGFATTSTVVDGQSRFSSMAPALSATAGYGIFIKDGINIAIRGVTIESTKGIYVTGINLRELTFDSVYQEGNAGPYMTITGCGYGLSVTNSFAPGTTGIPAASVSCFGFTTFYGNTFSTPPNNPNPN